MGQNPTRIWTAGFGAFGSLYQGKPFWLRILDPKRELTRKDPALARASSPCRQAPRGARPSHPLHAALWPRPGASEGAAGASSRLWLQKCQTKMVARDRIAFIFPGLDFQNSKLYSNATSSLCKWWLPCIVVETNHMCQMGKMYLLKEPCAIQPKWHQQMIFPGLKVSYHWTYMTVGQE